MCNKTEETLEHLMLQCPCFRGAREKVPNDVVEMIEKAGGNKTLQTAAHLVLGVRRGIVPSGRTTVNHWRNQQYDKHWQEEDKNSSENEKVRALEEEIIVATEYSLPIWNGVVVQNAGPRWSTTHQIKAVGGGHTPAITRIQRIRVEDTNKYQAWRGGTPRKK